MSLPIAITMGDPAGIGGELTIAAWKSRRVQGPAFYVYDCPQSLHDLAKRLQIELSII